jgi:hypothetical protein
MSGVGSLALASGGGLARTPDGDSARMRDGG